MGGIRIAGLQPLQGACSCACSMQRGARPPQPHLTRPCPPACPQTPGVCRYGERSGSGEQPIFVERKVHRDRYTGEFRCGRLWRVGLQCAVRVAGDAIRCGVGAAGRIASRWEARPRKPLLVGFDGGPRLLNFSPCRPPCCAASRSGRRWRSATWRRTPVRLRACFCGTWAPAGGRDPAVCAWRGALPSLHCWLRGALIAPNYRVFHWPFYRRRRGARDAGGAARRLPGRCPAVPAARPPGVQAGQGWGGSSSLVSAVPCICATCNALFSLSAVSWCCTQVLVAWTAFPSLCRRRWHAPCTGAPLSRSRPTTKCAALCCARAAGRAGVPAGAQRSLGVAGGAQAAMNTPGCMAAGGGVGWTRPSD